MPLEMIELCILITVLVILHMMDLGKGEMK